MIDVENQQIDPNLGERRERIATAIFAQLIGRDADFGEEQVTLALKAADALIQALDSGGV